MIDFVGGPTKELICKGCSLSVQPGYPKCPRCKMPLPTVTAPIKATTRPSAQMQGGTAISEQTSNMGLVLGGVAIAAVGIVAALVMKSSTSSDSNETASAEPRARTTTAADAPLEQGDDDKPAQVGIVVDQGETARQEARMAAMRELEETLGSARLWSSVESPPTDDSLVVVQSGACVDDAMKPAIQAQAALLKGAGFAKVECLEKHGAMVFELLL